MPLHRIYNAILANGARLSYYALCPQLYKSCNITNILIITIKSPLKIKEPYDLESACSSLCREAGASTPPFGAISCSESLTPSGRA